MTDVLNLSFRVTKRAFTIAVVVATIAWSVAASFAIAPRAAHAAVSSGDLVKGSLAAVYFIGSDGKRYVFTSDKSYFTWYANFSTVKTISDTELAGVQIGGNVTYKPGVRMVKIQSDPKVYAIAHGGVLRWVKTEAAAVALYGADWNKKIDDISDAFFVNYTVGADIASASDFNIANEQSNSSTINADKGLAGGGAINVTLASDTPAGATVTRNAQSVNLLKVNLSGAGTVTGLTFHRVGAGSAGDWANIYLYDGDSRLTTGRSVSSTTNEVSFANLSVALAGSKTLTLVGDLVTAGATVGNAHAFALDAATKVVASATVGGAFPITGNTFMISGSTGGSLTVAATSTPSNPKVGQMQAQIANFKVTAGGNEDISLRRIVFTNSGSAQLANLPNMVLQTGGTTVASNPIINGNMLTFVFAVPYNMSKGTNRTFNFLADIGSANRPGTDTIKIYIDQTYDVYATGATYGVGVNITDNFGSGVATLLTIQGGKITYAFNGPVSGDIAIGGNDIPVLKVSITSANHIEIKHFNLQLTCVTGGNCIDAADTANASSQVVDLKVKNLDTGATLLNPVDLNSWTCLGGDVCTRDYTDRFEVMAGQTLNLAFTLDILSANTTLANKVLVAQLGARVAGDIRNLESNQDVTIATDVVPATALAGNNQTVRSSQLTVGLANTPTSSTVTKGSTANAVGINFTAGNSSDIRVTQIKLTGYIDLCDGAFSNVTDNDCGPAAHAVQDVIQSVTLWDGATQLGAAASPNTNGDLLFDAISWNVPAGTTKTVVAKLVLSTNLPFDVGTNQAYIDLLGRGTDNGTNNVTAEDKDGNQVTATSAAWTNEAGGLPNDIHVNDNNLGTESDSTPTAVITGVASGTVEVKLDGDTPVAAILTANTQNNTTTKIKFTSLNESFLVTRLTIENTNAQSSRSITSVTLYDKNGTAFCSGALDTNNRLRCAQDAGLFTIGSDHTISVKVSLAQDDSGTSGANSGDTPVIALYEDNSVAGTDNLKVVGVSSGTALLDADVLDQGTGGFSTAKVKVFDDSTGSQTPGAFYVSGNQFVVRKTQPTVATVLSGSTIQNGAEQTVYKFSVTAASNADVNLKRVNVTMSRSSVGVGFYKLLRNDSDISTSVQILNSTAVATAPASLDWENSTATVANDSRIVSIVWNTEETIAAGSTRTYTLRATVTDATNGDSISHFIADDSAFEATNDAGGAMNLGVKATLIAPAGNDQLLFDANNNGAADAGELTLDTNNAYAGALGVITGSKKLISDGGSACLDFDGDDVCTASVDPTFLLGGGGLGAAPTGSIDFAIIDDTTRPFADVDHDAVFGAADVEFSYGATSFVGLQTLVPVSGNFIWSDSSSDGHSRSTVDWTNGFNVNVLSTSPQALGI
jgi:hypothetical protein